MLQSTGSMARLPRRRERKSIQGCGALEETEVSSCARSPVREERWGQRGSPWLPPVRQGGLSLYPECHGNHWRVYQDSLSAGDCLWSAFMNEGLGETDPLEQGGRGRIFRLAWELDREGQFEKSFPPFLYSTKKQNLLVPVKGRVWNVINSASSCLYICKCYSRQKT